MQAISDLESDSPDVRRAATQRVLSARDVPHDQIRAIAEKHIAGPKKGTAKDAILLLGKLNSQSSIDWLLDHLTFDVFYKEMKRPQPPADRFPAVKALIDIGLPAIDPLLARAAASSDPDFHTAAAAVLLGVLGPRGAARRLQAEAASRPTGAAPKSGLAQTLEQVRQQAALD